MRAAHSPSCVALMDTDPGALGWLASALGGKGHRVLRLSTLEALLARLGGGLDSAPLPDLLIARFGGPPQSGLDLLRRVRGRSTIPCVLVAGTADDVDERVAALEQGADDYLPRGMAQAEMLARVGVALRRARMAGGTPPPLRSGWVAPRPARPADGDGDDLTATLPQPLLPGGWRLVPRQRALVAEDGRRTPIRLTGAEFELMRLLAASEGEPVDRDAISRTVFRRPWRVEDRAVDGLVKRLRRKFEQDAIATVRGVGYALLAGGAPVSRAMPTLAAMLQHERQP